MYTLTDLFHDELLSAKLLDAWNGCGRDLPVSLLKEARDAMKVRLQEKFDQ